MVKTFTSKDLKPVLMDPKAKQIRRPYYLIEGTGEGQIIYVLTSGLNGVEFNKTVGSFSSSEGLTLYQCLRGQGIVILQRNDEGDEAKEFKIVTLNSGRQVGVPAGSISSLVNIGKGFLVVLANGNSEENISELQPVIKKRGLAYYIVEKKGEIGFEQNPNYSVHPQISTE